MTPQIIKLSMLEVKEDKMEVSYSDGAKWVFLVFPCLFCIQYSCLHVHMCIYSSNTGPSQ